MTTPSHEDTPLTPAFLSVEYRQQLALAFGDKLKEEAPQLADSLSCALQTVHDRYVTLQQQCDGQSDCFGNAMPTSENFVRDVYAELIQSEDTHALINACFSQPRKAQPIANRANFSEAASTATGWVAHVGGCLIVAAWAVGYSLQLIAGPSYAPLAQEILEKGVGAAMVITVAVLGIRAPFEHKLNKISLAALRADQQPDPETTRANFSRFMHRTAKLTPQ